MHKFGHNLERSPPIQLMTENGELPSQVGQVAPYPNFNRHTLDHVQILVTPYLDFGCWTLSNLRPISVIGSYPMHNLFWSPCGQGSVTENQS
jgi:hypothetical protein